MHAYLFKTTGDDWDPFYLFQSCRLVNLGGLQFYDLGTQESVEFSTGSYKGDDVIIAKYTSADKAR